MIYVCLTKEDDARLAAAAKRLGKSKAAFAREAIESRLPILERQAVEKAGGIETDDHCQI